MNRARIALITPGALGSNPRLVKEARALAGAGFDVTTVSTRTLDSVDVLDADVLEGAPWRSIRIDFRSAAARRLPRVAQMAAAGVFRATGAAGLAARGYSVFSSALARAAADLEADLYVAHYPPALAAAARAAAARRARYAYDAEDFHLGDLSRPAAARLLRALEGRYLPGCAYVTAASPGIADAYVETYGALRPTVILNVFERGLAPASATPAGSAAPGPSVYWFSQTVGPNRGLECAVRALGLARSQPHLYLRGGVSPTYRKTLDSLAQASGVGGRLHFLATASPSSMVDLASVYDIGLAAETGYNRHHQIALSNKQFTYLLAGLPAVMSEVASHRAFAAEAPSATSLFATDDPASLAAALDDLLLRPGALAAARAEALRLGLTRYNWDREQETLLKLVRERGLGCDPSAMEPAR